jgi:hypothetical protein
MDYKKIIKSRSARLKILRKLSFIPDKPMLKTQYWIKTGHRLNLKNPKRFTEKLQWYKLYYRNPLMVQCVDKYDVREYVRSKGLEDILIPCYGVFNSVEEIDWESLPDSFVMKDTLGGGGNSVAIVRSKENNNILDLKTKAEAWASKPINKKGSGREWPYYSGKKHRIIIEHLLVDEDHVEEGINDYKIYCFNGKPFCIHVDYARFGNHRRNYYDTSWNRLNVESNYPKSEHDFLAPANLEKMLDIAHRLSSDFPFVRVDLYNIKGNIFFSEMTFFPASGYMWYRPDEFDFILGEQFILPNAIKK